MLRLPGTYNRKLEPVPVEVVEHEPGRRYRPEDFEPYLVAPEVVRGPAPAVEGEITAQHRNTTLTSLAGTMRRRGMSEDAIAAALLAENENRCRPPLAESEVRGIAHSIAKKAPAVDAEAEAALADLAAGEAPWPGTTEAGWNLLDVVGHFLARFVVFPSAAARDAAALWVVHTHALAAADSTPRLALLSAEKRSGKSRLLELLELLVASPMMTASISAAALFRQVEAVTPTLLMDEADTYFGKTKDDHEDLRGMLNAGHRRGAMAYRCAGPKMAEVKAYSAFAAGHRRPALDHRRPLHRRAHEAPAPRREGGTLPTAQGGTRGRALGHPHRGVGHRQPRRPGRG